MDTGFSFINDPYFYYLLVIGSMAMLPRARYTADRATALSESDAQAMKPNLAQRICLFFPGLCLLSCVVLLRYATGALVLLVLFLLIYTGLILFFKARR